MRPNFSARVRPFPWNAVPALSRDEARVESAFARALATSVVHSPSAASTSWSRLRRLLRLSTNDAISIRLRHATEAFDPHAACCEVRTAAGAFRARGSSDAVRAIAQHLLGGPDELRAPRPLDDVEASLWTLVVATALEDLGVPGTVWLGASGAPDGARGVAVDLDVAVGPIALVVRLDGGAELLVRAGGPPTRQSWLDTIHYDLAIVAGRCALHRDELARLCLRTVITLERPTSGAELDLDLFDGVAGLRSDAADATVVSGYVRRDMSLPDEAHVELTVTVGTTQLTLRQITELSVGEIIQLHRPLGGPFELRAAGRILGRGELVDVDGELAVRIVSLGDQEQ